MLPWGIRSEEVYLMPAVWCRFMPTGVSAVLFGCLVLLADVQAAPIGDQRQRARCSEKMAQFIPALDKVLVESPNSVRAVMDEHLRFLPLAECDIAEAISLAQQSRFFDRVDETKGWCTIYFYSKDFRVTIPFSKETEQMFWYGAMVIKTVDQAERARSVEERWKQRGETR
jgi:hypothetical protein